MNDGRVQCKKCDASILGTTSTQNNGYCTPCYKGRKTNTGVIRPSLSRNFTSDIKTYDEFQGFFKDFGITYLPGTKEGDERTHTGLLEIDHKSYHLGISSINRETDKVEGWVSLLDIETTEEVEKLSERLEHIFGEEEPFHVSPTASASTIFVAAQLLMLITRGLIYILAILGLVFLWRTIFN